MNERQHVSYSDSAKDIDEIADIRYATSGMTYWWVSCAKTKRRPAKCITGKFPITENSVFEIKSTIGTE